MNTSIEQKSDYTEEEEDDIISQIKQMATEIFEFQSNDSAEDEKFNDLSLIMMHENGSEGQTKSENCCQHSYTERRARNKRQVEESEWISNYEPSVKQKFISNDKERDPGVSLNENKPINFKKKITEQKKQRTKKLVKNPQQKQNKIDKNERKELNEIKCKESKNYTRPIKNLKPEIVNQIMKKKQDEARQMNLTRVKTAKTLGQLYQEKEPLYDRFMRQKDKREVELNLSRFLQEERQMEQFKGRPEVNNNIQVKGSFDERIKKSNKKKQENSIKILQEEMGDNNFRPKVHHSKKYEKVESVVKKSWQASKTSTFSSEELQSDGMGMKGLSHSLLKTGSFFSDQSHQNSPNKNKSLELKLHNINELSHILELEDMNEQ